MTPMTTTGHRLAVLWQQVLGFDGVESGTGFLAASGDAVAAHELAGRIRLTFNVTVSPAFLIREDTTFGVVVRLVEDELDAGPLSN